MADVTKNSFVPSKVYRGLIFQQGRPLLDFELNEAQAILRYLIQLAELGAIGNFPYGDGLKVVPDITPSLNARVLAGKFFDKGEVVELPTTTVVTSLSTTTQMDVEDWVYMVYRDAEISPNDDPDIYDQTVNIETARRTKLLSSVTVTHSGQRVWLSGDMNAVFLAKVVRTAGQTTVNESNIIDLRMEYNQNYVVEGFELTQGSGNQFTVSEGVAYVANVEFSVAPTTVELTADQTSYIWVDENGDVQVSSLKPGPPATLLYSVTLDASNSVVNQVDLRQYYPPLLGFIKLILADYLSPKRQLYSGDTTISSVDTDTPQTIKTFMIFNDSQIGFKITELGFVIRAEASGSPGYVELKVDGQSVYQAEVSHQPTGSKKILKTWTPVNWSDGSLHEVELSAWSTHAGGDPMAPVGEIRVDLFEGYVRDSSHGRRVLVFGDEGLDTINSTVPTKLKSVSVYNDNVVGLNIQRVNYVLELYAVGGPGTAEILIDGAVHKQFSVAEDTKFSIYKGIIPVVWETESTHTVEVRLTAPSGGTIYNRLFEIYVDQRD